jgi:putative transposase
MDDAFRKGLHHRPQHVLSCLGAPLSREDEGAYIHGWLERSGLRLNRFGDSHGAWDVIHHAGWRRRPAWMPGSYSQDLRDRVIDAVEVEGMSRRAAARRFGVSEASAIKWVQRYRRTGARSPVGTGGHRRSVLKPERDWLMAVLAEDPSITLAALSRRLAAERGVRADSSMLSRFFRKEGISFKKRRFTPASRTAPTSPAVALSGTNIRTGSTRAGSSSSTKLGPRPT